MANVIEKQVLQREMSYQGEVILKYTIEYPKLKSKQYPYGIEKFNEYNKQIAYHLKKYAERQLFEEAKKTYEYNKANGYPIMVYEVILNYTVTYQEKNRISLYMDQYIFSGGAHGNTIRFSQNWDLQMARQITLQEVYQNDPYYAIDILKEVNRQINDQIEEGKGTYFDDYCQLVLNTFRLNQFYLVPKGIYIFFQQYDIAPYSSGIPTFFIEP